MSSYMGTEGSTVTVCAVLGNVVAVTMGDPEVTTSDIMTTFNLTEGTNASKNEYLNFQGIKPPSLLLTYFGMPCLYFASILHRTLDYTELPWVGLHSTSYDPELHPKTIPVKQ